METRLEVPQGTYELRRPSSRENQPLRAWDAADEYALAHLDEHDLGEKAGPLLLNDTFGALSVALAQESPVVINESSVGRLAVTANHTANRRPRPPMLSITDPVPGPIDVLVVKIPKSAGQLEQQLHLVRPHLQTGSLILGAGMTRHVHTSTINAFESIVGPTTTSLARKKARLLHSTFDPELRVAPNPWPMRWTYDGLEIVNHGGVFSSRELDRGTRFLLGHVPDVVDGARVIDLGCGNGVVGAILGRRHRGAHICFFDESHVAVRSASDTWWANGLGPQAEFCIGARALTTLSPQAADLIVNNPPFHTDRSRGDETAWQMFIDSHKLLKPGGQLRVVGNRHLGYHAKLKKIFGNCDTVASNRKFVVLSATR